VLKAQKPLKKTYPDVLVTIGDHIRKKRSELNLTQLQVSIIIGVDECTVSNWEKHRSQPTIKLIPKIIQFLGCIPFDIEANLSGDKIKLYRSIRGISQKKLASEIGIDTNTLARWEKNKGVPYTNLLNSINNYFLYYSCLKPIS